MKENICIIHANWIDICPVSLETLCDAIIQLGLAPLCRLQFIFVPFSAQREFFCLPGFVLQLSAMGDKAMQGKAGYLFVFAKFAQDLLSSTLIG